MLCYLRAPLCAAAITALAAGSIAKGDISETVFIVQASNANGTANFAAHFVDGRMENGLGEYHWGLGGSTVLRSESGAPVAMLNDASVVGLDDPSVALNFNVFAGSLDTTFTITSATVSFGSLANPPGRASASLSITDLNGDGVLLNRSGGVGGAYTAFYNGAPPGGTVFHDLFAGAVATAISGDTATASEDFPGGGSFQTIPGAVSSIASRFQFTLSANDMASGTSVFTVQVPAPGSLALLGMSGMLFARRRAR